VRPVLFPARETFGESADQASKLRRVRPEFAQFAVSGTEKRRSPQCRKKFFSCPREGRKARPPRALAAIEKPRGRFPELARGFFKALFREGQTCRVPWV